MELHISDEQSEMTASQVPAPEPPKMEMITESYNLIDLAKTLNEHICKKGDITRYQKYLEKQKHKLKN